MFIDLIRRKGKRAHYIDFLVGLCSCLGEPVKSKQELVSDVIFGETPTEQLTFDYVRGHFG